MEKFIIGEEEYIVRETQDYMCFKDLFISSDLEFNLDESGLYPEGFIKAFSCEDAGGRLVAASSITKREGRFILNDIAVDQALRGRGIGELLLQITRDEIENLGGKEIFITAKAPKFFEKYGFHYLEKASVPDIFNCLDCQRYGKDCFPSFMHIGLPYKA